MRTKKLACQGCGADIDPLPGQKYIDCEYCGTTNTLESDTVHVPPGTAPQQGAPGAQIPQVNIQLPSGPSGAEMKKAGKIVALVALSVVIGVVGLGVVIFMQVYRGVSDARKQHKQAFKDANQTHSDARERVKEAKRRLKERLSRIRKRTGAAIAKVRKRPGGAFRLESDRPLTTDVDGDGIADLLVRGKGGVVAALDGTSAKELWRKSVSGRSRKLFLAGKLVLVAHGDHLTAFAVKDGTKRWSTKLPDRADQLELRKSGLAIETGDDERLTLDPATGKKKGGATAKFKLLTRDDGRKWMSNLGGRFRLKGRKRRARLYYCPDSRILRGKTVTRRRGPFTTRTTTYGCRSKRALAWAMDKRGRKAFIIGLKKGGGQSWEYQLPGRARRFGGRQPVVGMNGEVAAVAYGGGRGGKPTTVVALSLSDGKKKWAHTVAARSSVRGVVVTPKRVFIRVGSWVTILDVATGKPPKAGITSGSALPPPP